LHSSHALAIGLWAKLFYSGLKLIAVRRVDFHIKKNWLSQIKYRTRKLDRIVCISEAIRQVLLADGIPAEKLVTIHSGIDIHKFDHQHSSTNLKEQFGIPANHIVVGTIAAMVGHKDYPNLLNAAKIVIENQEDVTFIAVGDGSLKNSILELAEKLALGNRFIFAGFQKDIGSFLKIFDIFVLASRLEGLGTSILDAQSVGLPIVACQTGGISEIVWHEQNGLLAPRKDAAALAQAILQLTGSENLRKQFGSRSLQTVRAFDIKTTIAKNIELYEHLMKGKK
jgi:glycosyltransferase involved in cell wall biosynthesis